MSIINDFMSKYPYTDFHEMNLDWLIAQMLKLRTDMRDFINLNTIKYADPIQWNITTQYQGNTVVIEPVSGDAYLSTQPVPAGVAITDTDYWTIIGSFGSIFSDIKASIAAADEGPSTVASANREVDDLVWLSDKLYVVTAPIATGESYVPGTNCEAITVELLLKKEAETRESADTLINENISIINGSIATMAGDIQVINGSIATMAGDIQVINGSIATMAGDVQAIYTEIESLEGRSVHVVNSRNDVASVDADVNTYIIAANAYPGDGIRSYYKVTEDAADGFFNIEMDNGNTASLIHGDTIHAHQVGAFPNDMDCKPAIDAVITTIPGCCIYFGVGTYSFGGRIWLDDYQGLIGHGDDTILYCTTDPVEQHGEFIGILRDNGPQIVGCFVKNLAIRIYETTLQEDVNPFGIGNAKNVLIENVHILNSNWRGIQVETGATTVENLTIKNVTIEHVKINGIGISHTAGGALKNITLENIKIINPGGSYGGILLEGDNSKNIYLNNIYVETTNAVARAVYVVGCANVKINNIEVVSTATDIAYILLLQNSHNIMLSNIRMRGPATNDLIGLGLINSSDVLVNNMLLNNIDIGIRISSNDTSDRLIIQGIIGNQNRILCLIQSSATKGFLVAAISDGTVFTSSSPNFVKIPT